MPCFHLLRPPDKRIRGAMSHETIILETVFGKLEVLTSGDGPLLVWLHGEEGQRGWLDHHRYLAESFSVWAPTLPGALSEDSFIPLAWRR